MKKHGMPEEGEGRGTLGLERGRVVLMPYQKEWEAAANDTSLLLKGILGKVLCDVQHIGSTAILGIHAKPIIDMAAGVKALEDVTPYIEKLRWEGVIFRGEDVEGQLLFVMGDFEKDTRTHHIHVVKWGGNEWKRYLNFRDYLNAFPEKAQIYDRCKQRLAERFPDNRRFYTEGKQELIESLLKEARAWRGGF